MKQVYRRRNESYRSSKPTLHLKKTKIKIWQKTIFNTADGILTPCNVAGGSGMTFHRSHPNVHHIGILHYDFDHITAVDMSFCTSLRNFIQIGPPSSSSSFLACNSYDCVAPYIDIILHRGQF